MADSARPQTPPRTPAPWPTSGMSFGGDWSPEQWAPAVWREDIALMREAGVTMVTLGVFAWAAFEPRPGEYDWAWFDELLGLVHEAGIVVDLATPTAAPPSWLHHRHPEILPVEVDGTRQQPGHRLGWCPSSPVFRAYALGIVEALTTRYAGHPAVRLWHVSNELGGGNMRCYCDVSAGRFREWLRERYGSVDALNAAWGASFWGHTYADFAEIEPPRGPEYGANPGLYLDFRRFSSDELLAHFEAEADVIRRHSDAPVTTNFMVGSGGHVVDYSRWASHVDIVANDHYTRVAERDRHEELALAADRMRGLTRGRAPWLLMEHSTGAPSWQQRNRAKSPGEILRNSLAHVARGSNGAMFFQWRASTAGAEQFHSAMLPHAGTNTRVWREIVQLGATLGALSEALDAPVAAARVALLMDEESAWALQHGLKPHRAMAYEREPRAWHAAFGSRNVLVDVLPADADVSAYDLVIVPTLYLMGAARAERLRAYTAAGGTLLVTYLSGIADETGRVLTGGYPGALRDVLGVWTEEFRPLQSDEIVALDDGTSVTEWTEDTVLEGAEPVVRYRDGDAIGRAAVTRHAYGRGTSWYVSAQLSPDSIARIVDALIGDLVLLPTAPAPAGVEAVRREGADADFLFLINHTADDAEVAVTGRDVVTGEELPSPVAVAAGAVRIIREPRA